MTPLWTDAPLQPCPCCDGKGEVESIIGEPRPCSRCRAEAFDKWAAARRPDLVQNISQTRLD